VNVPELPDELRELESRLADFGRAEPSVALRGRVLSAVASELASRRLSDWWWYAGAAAALAVLWVNLSWTACRESSYDWQAAARPDGFAGDVRAIEQLIPGISQDEARREARLLRVGSSFAAPPLAPLPPPAGRAAYEQL
jgi:hypothetical protein